MKPKLYLESSVLSMLTTEVGQNVLIAAMREWTQRWWAEQRHQFQLFVSDFVYDEISKGDPEVAARRVARIEGIPYLADTKTVRRFARKLARQLSLPRAARMDAYHIAIAIEGGMDFLLTWNCRHIANAHYRQRIYDMADRRGFAVPVICSPRDFFEGDLDVDASGRPD